MKTAYISFKFRLIILNVNSLTLNHFCCKCSVVFIILMRKSSNNLLFIFIIEKHFTSDKSWPGPDISISIDPFELGELVNGSDAIHKALGGNKGILVEEQPTIDFAYASVVSIKDIKKGEKFSMENVWVKRPGTGEMLASEFTSILGRVASRDIYSNEQLKHEDII